MNNILSHLQHLEIMNAVLHVLMQHADSNNYFVWDVSALLRQRYGYFIYPL